MDEGMATPPQSHTERNKTRIIAEFYIKSHFGFEDSRRITKDSSWITWVPSGITVKSDFRVAFFIQSPPQPLLAGVLHHLLISLPNLGGDCVKNGYQRNGKQRLKCKGYYISSYLKNIESFHSWVDICLQS